MEKEQIAELAKEFAVDKKLIEILIARGYDTQDKLSAFLYPSLDNLTDARKYDGFDKVVERIRQAIEMKESVLIYGDYDCDGVCATSILYNYLKSQGAQVNCFLPNRHTDGYGLSIEALERLAEEYLSDLLITVDCGITAVEEVEYAREVLGFDVIVTDHHEVGENLPDCLIFNPKLSSNDTFRDLCGAGVALRIVEGLGGLEEMKKYLDIAAIATVADVVPLIGDNRIITHAGLKLINSFAVRRGVKTLVKSCVDGEVTAYDIAFKIAPRINSLGRLSDANGVLDIFCTTDNFLIENIVKEVNESNAKRMELTNDLAAHCLDLLKNYDFENKAVIVLHSAYWDDGIIGIVASKITETFNRPTLLFTKSGEVFKGSGRSIKGINIYKYVSQCSELLTRFGGHAMACGMSILEKNLDAFATKLNELIRADFDMNYFIPKRRYDLDMAQVDSALDMARGLKMLEPCGEGNPRIKFKESVYAKEFNQMGATSHVVCKERDKETVVYGGLRYKELLSQDVRKDLYLSLSLQTFNNRVYAQAKVSAIECLEVKENENFSAYVATGFFGGEEGGIAIDWEAALSLGNTLYSTCYVAYDIDTYKAFFAKYVEKYGDIVTQNGCVSSCVPVTKILFSPTSLKELGYYRKVVFLDKPLGFRAIEKAIGKNTKLYYVNDVKILSKLKKYLPDYKKLSQIFLALRETLEYRDFFALSDLYYAIAKKLDLQYNEFMIAAVVFADLGILKSSGKLFVDKSVKTKLSESRIYKLIEEASGRAKD
ncbi:MAG: single-stranded-DNA-specific exonuclease RecJ [Clostridia bacterium]|nr:single-stranded-DNA-specific exonuclease RecJ [Clostridia bacterium]MDE7328762.1 single-stranded-DNA-specific exonuclease RecJ [Clostridia bacterium]